MVPLLVASLIAAVFCSAVYIIHELDKENPDG